MASWNANGGIKVKTPEISNFIKIHNLDLLLIQETLLISKDKFLLAGHSIYRTDRPGTTTTRRGGGTAIIINNQIKHHQTQQIDTKSIESTSLEIETSTGKLQISSCYSSPQTKFSAEDIEKHLTSSLPTILAGDFNAKHPAWNSKKTNNRGKALYQHSIKNTYAVLGPIEPTHYSNALNFAPDVLDIAIINNLVTYIEIESLPELPSDHNPVLITIFNTNTCKIPPHPRFLYKKANWPLFRTTLDNKLNDATPPLNTPEEIDKFTNILTTNIEESMITAIPKMAPSRNSLFDLPPGIVQSIKARNRTRRSYQRIRSPELKRELNKENKILKEEIQTWRRNKWEETVQKLNFKDCSIWKMSKKLQRIPESDPPIKGKYNIATSNQDKANILAQTLSESFIPNPENDETDPILEAVEEFLIKIKDYPDNIEPITIEELHEIAHKLPEKKAPGQDGITNLVIKNMSLKSIQVLIQLQNSILTTNHFPTPWKSAKVVTFLKPGKNPRLATSYRPISLLSNLSKLTERAILTRLLKHIDQHQIIPPEQFGFRTKHSTVQQLLRVTNYITEGTNKKTYTAAAFLDISKAFDRVWYEGLFYKLINLKFPPHLIFLIKSYLTQRTFHVNRKNSNSATHNILAGVPQGSVIGPVLFNIFTSDFPTNHPFTIIALYADDAAILSQSRNPNQARIYLQRALDTIADWYKEWRIAINVEKTQAIIFTSNRQLINPPLLILENKPIPYSKSVKYLGLTIDQHLTWQTHIKDVRNKANQKLASIYPLMISNQLSMETKISLYSSVIRPTFMYASPIWSNTAKTNLFQLQTLQNKALRLSSKLPMWTPCHELNETTNQIPLSNKLMKIATDFYTSVKNSPIPYIAKLADIVITSLDTRKRPIAATGLPQHQPPPKKRPKLTRKRPAATSSTQTQQPPTKVPRINLPP